MVLAFDSDRYFMPDWKWEHLNESVARKYCDRHIRLNPFGQLRLDYDPYQNENQPQKTPINEYFKKPNHQQQNS